MRYLLLGLMLLTGCSMNEDKWYIYFPKMDKYYEIEIQYVNVKDKCVGEKFYLASLGYRSEVVEAMKFEQPIAMKCKGEFNKDCEKWYRCPKLEEKK